METRDLAGKPVAFDDDGHMANREDWNEDVARALANEDRSVAVDPDRIGLDGHDALAVARPGHAEWERAEDSDPGRRAAGEIGVTPKQLTETARELYRL